MKPGLLAEAWRFYQAHPQYQSHLLHLDHSTASLAGWVCMLAAAIPDSIRDSGMSSRTVDYHDQKWDVPELACLLTGVTPCEGRWLFNPARTLGQLQTGVGAILDDKAIPGRPYHIFPDTNQRYAGPNGSVVIVVHRRTVLTRAVGRWYATVDTTRQAAAERGRTRAVFLGATLIPRKTVTYVRSLPA